MWGDLGSQSSLGPRQGGPCTGQNPGLDAAYQRSSSSCPPKYGLRVIGRVDPEARQPAWEQGQPTTQYPALPLSNRAGEEHAMWWVKGGPALTGRGLQAQPAEQLHHLLVQPLVRGIHPLLPLRLKLQLRLGQLKVVHLQEGGGGWFACV